MQRYVVIVITERNMAEQKGKFQELTDEVEACRVLIESLEVTIREAHSKVQRQQEHKGEVSQFRLKHLHILHSGGGQIDRALRNVLCYHGTHIATCMY